MLATSPEAAMLGRFGDIPVGYYTGTADISIPLYTIKEDGLEIPIVLSYHSSGIKVADQATNVGLGWLLEPGGAIIQIVNGAMDGSGTDNFISQWPAEYSMLKSNIQVDTLHGVRPEIGVASWPCNFNQIASGQDWYEPMQLLVSLGALQPDIYQYSFPGGYSGKFYIDPETGRIVLLDKKQQITFTQGGGSAWTATTLNGDKYYFNIQEIASDGSGRSGTTFKLSQIVMHNGKTINFSYTNTTYSWLGNYHEFFHVPYQLSGLQPSSDNQVQSSGTQINYDSQTISQIQTKDVIINFNQGTRQDMQTPCIQSVDIVNPQTNKKIKTFTMNYSYFGYNQIGSPNTSTDPSYLALYGERLKLASVQETGYDPVTSQVSTNPPYQFSYNESQTLPLKSSFAVDYWGYYNGNNNNRLIPDLTYPYYAGMVGIKYPIFYLTHIVNGGNRAVDTSRLSINMLKKITYPAGGSTVFNYESNNFTNYDYPDVNKIANTFTVVNATDYNNPPYDHSTVGFTLSRQVTIPITCTFSRGVPANSDLKGAQMQSAYVNLNKIENGITTTLEQWNMSNQTAQNTFDSQGYYSIQTNYTFTYDPNATYQLVASLPDNLGDEAVDTKEANVNGAFTYYNVPIVASPLSYGGGVRIKSIVNYDSNEALISNKSLQYVNANGTSSGLLMSPLQLTYYMRMLEVYSTDGLPDGQLPIAIDSVWYQSSESSIPFSSSAGGNIIGYSRVIETELANNASTNGLHIYNYNNTPSENGTWDNNLNSDTHLSAPDNPNLLNGMLTNEQIYNNAGNLLQQNNYNYIDLKDSTYIGYKVKYNVITNTTCGDDESTDTWISPDAFRLYTIVNYPLNSHWYMMSKKTMTHYDGVTPLTTNEYYAYNKIGQLVVDSTINSKNQSITAHYIYPYDKFTSSPTAVALADSGFFNNLLEQHLYNNGVETSEAKIGYKIIDGLLVRDSLNRSYNGNPLFNDVTFEHYGPNKTLKQVTERSAQPSAFLYDQNNSYLIADVKNAVLSDIAYSSFELNQPGNWTMSSTSGITQNLGFSGSQSFTLSSSNTLSKSGLTSTQSYIVSYWTNGTAPLTIAGTATGYPIKGVTLNGWTYYEHLVTGQTSVTLSGTGNIDEVRLYPQTAQMNTYTYNPLIGISSMVNAKNQINYYEYDGFQRLINIKDQYGNIIKHMSYHYQGQ